MIDVKICRRENSSTSGCLCINRHTCVHSPAITRKTKRISFYLYVLLIRPFNLFHLVFLFPFPFFSFFLSPFIFLFLALLIISFIYTFKHFIPFTFPLCLFLFFFNYKLYLYVLLICSTYKYNYKFNYKLNVYVLTYTFLLTLISSQVIRSLYNFRALFEIFFGKILNCLIFFWKIFLCCVPQSINFWNFF